MVEADRKTWSADYDGIALITGCTILALVKNVALVAAHEAALLKSPARAARWPPSFSRPQIYRRHRRRVWCPLRGRTLPSYVGFVGMVDL